MVPSSRSLVTPCVLLLYIPLSLPAPRPTMFTTRCLLDAQQSSGGVVRLSQLGPEPPADLRVLCLHQNLDAVLFETGMVVM